MFAARASYSLWLLVPIAMPVGPAGNVIKILPGAND
jgi:hypothetical protein